jgi:Toprim domain-containing protein
VRAHAEAERSRAAAVRLWRRRRPASGSPVEVYLGGRGLAVPQHCPWLGFAPDLEYRDGDGRIVARLPAMLAAIQGSCGRLIGVHRTYLQQLADGGVRKARLSAAKKVLGHVLGGAIRLSNVAGDSLALAEGIETGLSVQQATGLPVWAVVAVDNFRTAAVPRGLRRVILLGDGDEPDLAARIAAGQMPTTPAGRALARAVGRFRRDGRDVVIAVPPVDGHSKRDWNDVLRSAA